MRRKGRKLPIESDFDIFVRVNRVVEKMLFSAPDFDKLSDEELDQFLDKEFVKLGLPCCTAIVGDFD